MKPLEKEQFVCIDCETTGLDPKQDRIIEVAAVRFTIEESLESFESLINPECIIPETSIEIHNISQEMVSDKPVVAAVLPELLQFIGKSTLVGHGIGFDIDVVTASAERAGIPCTLKYNAYIDTLRLARYYGESPTNSLEQLRRHFNIGFEGAHRAMNDVVVNIEVFKYLAKKFKTAAQVFDVLSKPIALKVMPLGKHKGRPFKEIPLEYLLWAAKKEFDQDLLFSIRSEIKRRKKGGLFSQATNPFSALDLQDTGNGGGK